MVTLHGYVLRELLKTFALALVALTALFTMGGGLYNVLRYEGISTGDLFGFIPMLIPIVLTLTMPVAALFAATMVYGRLAADNELLACRAAGVNVHRLFLSALLLAVFVASFTLLFGDLIIPDFVRRLDHYARANLRDIAYQKLQVSGHVRYESGGERFLLTARRAEIPTDAALEKQNLLTEDGLGYLLVEAPAFLQMKGNHLVRYASARYGLCQFDGRSTPVQVTIYVDNGRDFDFGGRIVRLERQQLGPISIPLKFERKASMVDLATLVRWRQRPWEVDKLRPEVEAFQLALTRERFLKDCQRRIAAGEVLTLQDERDQTYRISAAGASVDHKGLMLADARVVNLSSDNPDRPLYYEAPQVLLSLSPSVDGKRLLIELHLRTTADRPVIEHNPRQRLYTRPTQARFVADGCAARSGRRPRGDGSLHGGVAVRPGLRAAGQPGPGRQAHRPAKGRREAAPQGVVADPLPPGLHQQRAGHGADGGGPGRYLPRGAGPGRVRAGLRAVRQCGDPDGHGPSTRREGGHRDARSHPHLGRAGVRGGRRPADPAAGGAAMREARRV